LVELYLSRLETRELVQEKNELLRRIARVFEERLDDKNQAFDALVNAFAEDFSDDETARYLERMAQATGRWGELINTANAWLPEQTEDKQKIRLCLRLGKWYGETSATPSTPSRTTSRSWRSTRTTFRSCARWRPFTA